MAMLHCLFAPPSGALGVHWLQFSFNLTRFTVPSPFPHEDGARNVSFSRFKSLTLFAPPL